MGVAPGNGGVQTYIRQGLGNHRRMLIALIREVDHQPFANDFANRHARAQAAVGVLKHDLNILAQRLECLLIQIANCSTTKPDITFASCQFEQRHAQRGFAATALADNTQRFTRPERQADIFDCAQYGFGLAEKRSGDRESDIDILDVEQRSGICITGGGCRPRICVQKLAGVIISGVIENDIGAVGFDFFAVAHYHHMIGIVPHDREIMGDQ